MRNKFAKDPIEATESAMVELGMIQQQEIEDLDAFEDRVTQLVYRAYPEAEEKVRVRQSIIAMSRGVYDRILRRRLLENKFSSLNELRAFALRCNHAAEICKPGNSWRYPMKRQETQTRQLNEETFERESEVKKVEFAAGTKSDPEIMEILLVEKELSS